MWWKWLLLVWIAAVSVFGIMTPIAGTFGDMAFIGGMDETKEIPVAFSVVDRQAAQRQESGALLLRGKDREGVTADVLLPAPPPDLATADGYLVRGRYDPATRGMVASAVLATNPGMTFPFIPGLEERARIIVFHVPMAWMTVIAFLVSMWFGIAYLRRRDLEDDARSAASAGLGLLFCLLATVTGSLWAKFNWNSFWNWDPRETSIAVLLLVYGAYFALRSAIDSEEKRAALSAVYSIMAAVTVPFFIFIMPRIMPGLHPGSSNDTNAGPAMSSGGMNAVMRVALYAMLLGFIVLYAWLMSIRVRLHRLILRRETAAQEG